jgi:hypothetical protein
MLGVHKRREVKSLLREHKPVVVARRAGVSLSSVKRIAKEPDVFHLDDAAERRRRRIGRPSKVRGIRDAVVELLDRSPDIRSIDILRRVRLMGYTGGKTALYSLVATLRAERDRDRDASELPAPGAPAQAAMSSHAGP